MPSTTSPHKPKLKNATKLPTRERYGVGVEVDMAATNAPDHAKDASSTKDSSSKSHTQKQQKDLPLSHLLPVPSPAEFISILDKFTTFDDFDNRKLMEFEYKLGLFGTYGKNILSLGRVGSRTYYIRVYPVTPGSINDDEDGPQSPLRDVQFCGPHSDDRKYLVIGRLIVEELQTYWIVAIDSEHKLYALRASQIGPDEEYDDNESPNSMSSKAISTCNGSSSDDHSSFSSPFALTDIGNSGCRRYVVNSFVSDKGFCSKTSKSEAHQNSYSTQHYGIDGYYDSNEDCGAEKGVTEKDGADKKRAEKGNRINDFKLYGPRRYDILRHAVFSRKHSRTANVFDATATQHVFDLGPLDLLQQALKNTEQEFYPKSLLDVISWTSMPITSA